MAEAGDGCASKAAAVAFADAEGTADGGGVVVDDDRRERGDEEKRFVVEFGGVKREERGKEEREGDLAEDFGRREEA